MRLRSANKAATGCSLFFVAMVIEATAYGNGGMRSSRPTRGRGNGPPRGAGTTDGRRYPCGARRPRRGGPRLFSVGRGLCAPPFSGAQSARGRRGTTGDGNNKKGRTRNNPRPAFFCLYGLHGDGFGGGGDFDVGDGGFVAVDDFAGDGVL